MGAGRRETMRCVVHAFVIGIPRTKSVALHQSASYMVPSILQQQPISQPFTITVEEGFEMVLTGTTNLCSNTEQLK